MRYVTSTIAAFMLASAVGVFAQEQAPAQQPPESRHRTGGASRTGASRTGGAQIDTHRLCGAGEDD